MSTKQTLPPKFTRKRIVALRLRDAQVERLEAEAIRRQTYPGTIARELLEAAILSG
jgi:hypothetical protein